MFFFKLLDFGGFGAYCPTANYKMNKVRKKEFLLEKKKDFSREIKKELKIMWYMRHDNINSLIGACVEMNFDPWRITLITNYCSKGSLYDILENDDIKLDLMFISSLIYDLIKVNTDIEILCIYVDSKVISFLP